MGRNWKHTIEPRIIYRYTNGVERFSNIIRFDFRDILSNTNEVEFGLIQRFYARRAHSACAERQAQAARERATGISFSGRHRRPIALPQAPTNFLPGK